MRLNVSAEDVCKLREELERRGQSYITLTDPAVLKGAPHIQSWYQGPDHAAAWCWPAYRSLLEAEWPSEAVAALRLASTKIMAFLPHPGENPIRTRGLVVGYVQSGKTASYAALIAMAADAGYKLFIILSGVTTTLRRQTQRRLKRDLCDNHPQRWSELTSIEHDFREQGNPDFHLNPDNPSVRIIAVV